MTKGMMVLRTNVVVDTETIEKAKDGLLDGVEYKLFSHPTIGDLRMVNLKAYLIPYRVGKREGIFLRTLAINYHWAGEFYTEIPNRLIKSPKCREWIDEFYGKSYFLPAIIESNLSLALYTEDEMWCRLNQLKDEYNDGDMHDITVHLSFAGLKPNMKKNEYPIYLYYDYMKELTESPNDFKDLHYVNAFFFVEVENCPEDGHMMLDNNEWELLETEAFENYYSSRHPETLVQSVVPYADVHYDEESMDFRMNKYNKEIIHQAFSIMKEHNLFKS